MKTLRFDNLPKEDWTLQRSENESILLSINNKGFNLEPAFLCMWRYKAMMRTLKGLDNLKITKNEANFQ